mgnify:CR=1 FL=1
METLNTSAESISKGIQILDKALNTKLSDTEKQAASKTASETVAKEFANGKTQEVAKPDLCRTPLQHRKKMAAQRMAHYLLLFMMALIVQMQQKPCIMKW